MALALAGIAFACGGSSDLDFAELDAGSSVGGAPAVTQHSGGYGATVGPPIGTAGKAGGGIIINTGGTVSAYCAAGYACPYAGAICGNGSMTCQCVNGTWAICSYPGTGATAAGGAASIPSFVIGPQGYVLSGNWHGYAWTAGVTSAAAGAGTTTIYPPDYSTTGPGTTALCAQGSIGAAPDYGGVALIGMNVNQDMGVLDGGEQPMGTVATGGYGVTVQYTNPGNTEIRVQVQTPTGVSDPTGRWCAVLKGSGGTETLPWTSFWGGVADTTQGCWNSGGKNPPIGTQISQVAIVVPGSNVTAIPYNMCLYGISQAG